MKEQILSKRLKMLRNEKGYMQKFVADKIGVRSNTLSGYENGTRSPDPDTINKLAELYNVTTDYLLGRTENPEVSEEIEKDEIINKIATEFPDADLMFHDLSNMTAEDLEDVYDYIKFKRSKKGDWDNKILDALTYMKLKEEKINVDLYSFEADSIASTTANQNEVGTIENSFFTEQINPGSEISGKVVFDVSPDVAEADNLKVEAQEGIFGSVTKTIKLQ